MQSLKQSRKLSFLFTIVVYALALFVALFVYRRAGGSALFRVFAADIAATVFVYAVSLPLGNASVYDPYWSVAPIVILPLCIADFGVWSAGTVALLVCVGYWGIRLTANWAYTFKGYDHQDWRYTMLRERSGAFYPLVSLFGIMLFELNPGKRTLRKNTSCRRIKSLRREVFVWENNMARESSVRYWNCKQRDIHSEK